MHPHRSPVSMVPGPVSPLTSGPPTAFALSVRPWLLCVLGLLAVVSITRFLALDPFGGWFVFLAVVMGWQTVKESMDIPRLLCFGLLLFFNAIFDAFVLFVHVMHEHGSMFGPAMPWRVNVIHAALLVGPIISLWGASICWNVYKDRLENIPWSSLWELEAPQTRLMALGGTYGAVGSGTTSQAPTLSAHSPGACSSPSALRASPTMSAYQGVGHRLTE
eukprot:gnl/TRDRNA2_/TRDRNA2_188836_c0_seq1.p1 gnl/TRDRNA2_/TRDRNA2_188836_c0~~gnl/TRDRNA2_/TRDRNA2_188836_c0_seq1.p1  ORF type:complete len:219 (-),score=17.07 gnl/TRDRNA2_/TRDRNA2_188836_c0_seq1:173-829(-)